MNRQGLMLMAAAAAVLAGCTQPNPYTDADFGRSTALMKAQQVINPDAARSADTAAGIDGKAVKGAMDNYRNSYKTPDVGASAVPPSGQ